MKYRNFIFLVKFLWEDANKLDWEINNRHGNDPPLFSYLLSQFNNVKHGSWPRCKLPDLYRIKWTCEV